jgi:hypothetical protein
MSNELDTATIVKEGKETATQSSIMGVSVRAWLAVILVITVCYNHAAVATATIWSAVMTNNFQLVGSLTTIGEPLYSMSVAALGFYFGNQMKNK